MVQRWTLHDGTLSETYVFPVNPNKMTSINGPRALTIIPTAPNNATPESQGRVIEGNQDPYEWQFSGFIRTQDHHDELRRWSRKVNRLRLTDHFGRQWYIRMTAFEPEEKTPTMRTPWRFNYTMKALMYGPYS